MPCCAYDTRQMEKKKEKEKKKEEEKEEEKKEKKKKRVLHWVQCSKCDKWRTLHHAANPWPKRSDFECDDNTWCPRRASCEAAEESWGEDNESDDDEDE